MARFSVDSFIEYTSYKNYIKLKFWAFISFGLQKIHPTLKNYLLNRTPICGRILSTVHSKFSPQSVVLRRFPSCAQSNYNRSPTSTPNISDSCTLRSGVSANRLRQPLACLTSRYRTISLTVTMARLLR